MNEPELIQYFFHPFQTIFLIIGLWNLVGWSFLAGFALLLILVPTANLQTKWTHQVLSLLMAAKDRRITIINEVLQGIRIVKVRYIQDFRRVYRLILKISLFFFQFFGWESRFQSRIESTRLQELQLLWKLYLQNALNQFIWLGTPVLVSFVTLTAWTQFSDKKLDAQTAFTSLMLFDQLKWPLFQFPGLINTAVQAGISLGRLEAFMKHEELERYNMDSPENNGGDSLKSRSNEGNIRIQSGRFQYFSASNYRTKTNVIESASLASTTVNSSPTPHHFTLQDIDISIPTGRLTTICGSIGVGKSSVLQAILGELQTLSGAIIVPKPANSSHPSKPTIAYVAQTSWIQNATVRDNITFGEPFDPDRYHQVIQACALSQDLKTFPSGDLTEIGEKGINLSGGQKQRVALARAAYSKAGIVLMDDPLSAVDAPTARHLFEKLICGFLEREARTRVLVTHATSLVLPKTDYMVVMKEGKVQRCGEVQEVLMDPKIGSVVSADLKLEMGSSTQAEKETRDDFMDKDYINDYSFGKSTLAGKLVNAEDKARGAVKASVYATYFAAAGGMLFVARLISVSFMDRVAKVMTSYWIKIWVDSYDNKSIVGDRNSWFYVGVYGAMSVGWILIFLTGTCC
jgi:ABC-type multidrug transport system fused ATPase/permease subunit